MKYVATLFLLFSLFSSPLFAQASVGELAPDFTLTSLENEQVKLSELRGEIVYIFFFGANCPHCRDNGPITESEIFQSFSDNENFVALGIDTWNTSAASVNNFKNITGITYPLLLNGRSSLVDYYGNSSAYDRSVVIAANGTIAYKGTGFVNSDFEQVNESIQNELALATSIDPSQEIPSSVRLEQNFPNPFNPSTTISYSLNEASEVSITIYNLLGAKVATLESGFRSSGSHSATFDASALSSGIYFYRLVAGATTITKRMSLVK